MIVGQTPSIVDNILTYIFEKSLNSGNLIDKITDHLANFLFMQTSLISRKTKKLE